MHRRRIAADFAVDLLDVVLSFAMWILIALPRRKRCRFSICLGAGGWFCFCEVYSLPRFNGSRQRQLDKEKPCAKQNPMTCWQRRREIPLLYPEDLFELRGHCSAMP